MRGEYFGGAFDDDYFVELPPRARRILVSLLLGLRMGGTTSACAENTNHHGHSRQYPRNYLRVRGEYQSSGHAAGTMGELPPRARRIHAGHLWSCFWPGTTSACAENTLICFDGHEAERNYLRVRGEYHGFRASPLKNTELPPRARRILKDCDYPGVRNGTTSACAENT